MMVARPTKAMPTAPTVVKELPRSRLKMEARLKTVTKKNLGLIMAEPY